jgi:hypothetical protein
LSNGTPSPWKTTSNHVFKVCGITLTRSQVKDRLAKLKAAKAATVTGPFSSEEDRIVRDALNSDGSPLDTDSIRGLWSQLFPGRTLSNVRARVRSLEASISTKEKGPITEEEGKIIVRIYNEQRGAHGWGTVATAQLGRTSMQVRGWKKAHPSLFRTFGTESSNSGGGGSGDKEEQSDEDLN